MRWVVVVKNELKPKAKHITNKPTGVHQNLVFGNLCITAKMIGRSRYMISMAQAPMIAMLLDPAKGG